MVHVLRAPESLARPRPELALEEVREGLLDDVADPGEVALLDATDQDFRQAALGIEPGAIDGRSHAGVPARSSRSVMTPE